MHEAAALVLYLQRAHPIIPTTGMEYEALRGAMQIIEMVANGIVSIEIKPVIAPAAAPDLAPASEATAPARQPRKRQK